MDIKKNLVIVILILSFLLVFVNLGNRVISADESLTTIVAKTVAEKGYPSALYDNGQLIITKEGAYANVFGKDVYAWNSWLEYYLAALPLKLFGMSEFMLRFPFALFGLFTIVLFYFFARKLTNNKEVSLVSLIILATSVPFLLHIRQARWYPLVMFFSLALLFSYLCLLKKEKKASFYFILSAILLFHSNFFIFLSLFFGLLIHFIFFFKEKNKREIFRKSIVPLLLIFILTFPWFYLTQLSKATYLKFSLMTTVINFFLSCYYIFIYMFPLIFILLIPLIFKKYRTKRKDKESSELKDVSKNYLLVFIVILTYLVILSLKIDALPGMRSLIFLMPLFCLIIGNIIYKIKEKNKVIAYLLLILLIFTNFLHLFPFVFFKSAALNVFENFYAKDSFSPEELTSYEKQTFIENSLNVRFFFFDYLYEITRDYDSSDELIVNYMIKNGNKNDTFIASSFPNTILLYTGMNMVDLNAGRIDWIVIRGFKVRADIEENFTKSVNEKINLSNYDKIVINSLEERWADAPDPVNHRFKTDKNGTVILYHLKK